MSTQWFYLQQWRNKERQRQQQKREPLTAQDVFIQMDIKDEINSKAIRLKEQEMSTLRFSDGITVTTEGPLRTLRLKDGYYVVGEGMLMPVESRAEAQEVIAEFTAKRLVKPIKE